MVLKRPRKESARRPPNKGKRAETPAHMLTFFAAVAVGWWRTLMRYIMRFPARP